RFVQDLNSGQADFGAGAGIIAGGNKLSSGGD
ncbi:MAG: hypothetical protein JWM57_373, partial [Phycisphaerales bacterium]|nr:hypothetical protein [Phycisphaerales bacterium]